MIPAAPSRVEGWSRRESEPNEKTRAAGSAGNEHPGDTS